MNAKEIKLALADEGVQANIEKQIATAVKAETKRIVALVKDVEVPDDKSQAKAVNAVIKEIVAAIKS